MNDAKTIFYTILNTMYYIEFNKAEEQIKISVQTLIELKNLIKIIVKFLWQRTSGINYFNVFEQKKQN